MSGFRKVEYTGQKDGNLYQIRYLDDPNWDMWTTETPNKYKIRLIEHEANDIVKIKFDNKYYNSSELKELYSKLAEEKFKKSSNENLEITNSKILSAEEISEVKKHKTLEEARKWKSKLRALRKKGKLEQYKIDMLNKLGMIWHPQGKNSSSNEWEKNFIAFKTYGLCFEIKEWVVKQRNLYAKNEMPNENLFRLQSADFPFKELDNEKYRLTTVSCWGLREKLEKKVKEYISIQQKKHSLNLDEELFYNTPKRNKKQDSKDREVNSFYNRRRSYCIPFSLKKMDDIVALEYLDKMDKGVSYYNQRLKEFLDLEIIKFKKTNKRIPTYIKSSLDEISDDKLDKDAIYNQLSSFISSDFKPLIRKRACEYMLNYLSNRNLKESNYFIEIKYLIYIYKREKNIQGLTRISKIIQNSPLITELYGESLNKALLSLSQ
jgi:hypothetical protein